MSPNLERIWIELERDYSERGEGIYRRLDLAVENGIRIAVIAPGRTRAVLVELGDGDRHRISPPLWRGMSYKSLVLDVPSPGTNHACLCADSPEHWQVFTAICSDIIRTLESCDISSRIENLQICFNRWSRFFENCGIEGLSPERQRGLFGELILLEKLLLAGIPSLVAVNSWKGCHGNEHDFLIEGNAIEVKTTISREPRKVRISNERQLDESDLNSLCLYVITLHPLDDSGRTLPQLLRSIRERLAGDGNATFNFECGLIASGYLSIDEERYTGAYAIRKAEPFTVGPEFPRVISVPHGVGDLQYTIMLSTCQTWLIPEPQMLANFKEGA